MKRIVIIGGGFAGSLAARKLEKKFDVTLIDTKDYFEFTPGVLKTLINPDHSKNIQVLHNDYLKHATIIIGEVSYSNDKYVLVEDTKIEFDYLIICSGSSYNSPFKEENIVIASRSEHLIKYHEDLIKSNKILIIGGGLVGVELAAEISTNFKDKDITLIHSKSKLIDRNPDRAIEYAHNFLINKGVKINYNQRMLIKRGDYYISDNKDAFYADIAFLCTGITPNFEFMKKEFKEFLDNKNNIIVNDYLQVSKYKNIFAAGDITSINEEKTAQNAKRQVSIIIKNIISIEKNKPFKKYISKPTPLVISLGSYNGLLIWNKIVITGLIPGFLKHLVEKKEMFALKFL